ncbi:MAG TPA: hypothetical protein VMW09_01530 [Desulfatiglandales bacterium]|nr:hypothetical protein [Desulfatiglandales bacterium]
MDVKTTLEEIYNQLPDEEPLLDFDAFLIGDGSAKLMQGIDKRVSKSRQLIGINSTKDLDNLSKKEEFKKSVDDIDKFDSFPEFLSEDKVFDLFLTKKKEIFDYYGYLSIKSQAFKGRPVLEKDLVVSKDDRYLLSYILEKELNEISIIKSLAQLLAYKELGVLRVIFRGLDGCALCNAYNGNTFNVESLISKLSSGESIAHRYCTCAFIPIFNERKFFEERIQVNIDSVYIGKVLVKNMPKEFEIDLFTHLPKLDCTEVVFKDFTKFEDWSVDVVRKEGDILFVHNDYIRGRSPLDYLLNWIDMSSRVEVIILNDVSNMDVYYLNGHKVIEKDGNFIDIDTGKVVSVV